MPRKSQILSLVMLAFTCGPVAAADFRELNNEGIKAVKAGKLDEARSLFKQSLDAYVSELGHYDEGVKANLAMVEGLIAESKNTNGAVHVGRISKDSNQNIKDFVLPFFEKEASKHISSANISMSTARIEPRPDGIIDVNVSRALAGNRTLELEAHIREKPGGGYQMLLVHSDVFRPISQSQASGLFGQRLSGFAEQNSFSAGSDAYGGLARLRLLLEQSNAQYASAQSRMAELQARVAAQQEADNAQAYNAQIYNLARIQSYASTTNYNAMIMRPTNPYTTLMPVTDI